MGEWRLTTYNRQGDALAEYESDALVSWVINDVGQLEFTIANRDPKCVEEYFRFGNLVRFSHSTAGDWGGVIWTPQIWSASAVTVKALSAEVLFKHRRGPANKTWKGTAGQIYEQIIFEANKVEDTRIRVGNIWYGGQQRQETCRDDILYDAIKRVQERSANDFFLRPDVQNGRLFFEANWVEQIGDVNGFQLVEGVNVRLSNNEQILVVQGDIINDVALTGIGASVSSRPRATWSDTDSIEYYGLRQGSENNDAETTMTLQANAKAYIADNKMPRRTFRVAAVDAVVGGVSTFSALGIGDIVYLYLSSVGFFNGDKGVFTRVRILGKELSTKDQAMQLVIDEVL